MKLKLLSVCAVLCLSMITANSSPTRAQLQELQPAEPEWMVEMYGQGWEKVGEGVLQRSEGEGSPVETFIYNEDGLRWWVQWLQGRVRQFEALYDRSPSEDLARFIEGLQDDIEQTQDRIDSGDTEPYMGEQIAACTPSVSATAVAEPLTGAQAPGVTARATAQFSSSCGEFGKAYSSVYVHAVGNFVDTSRTQTDDKPESTSVSTLAQDSASGSTDCISTASARVESGGAVLRHVTDDNFSCYPLVSPTITVSGTLNYYISSSSPCATATWSAAGSGGTPGYAIDWYIGTAYQGSGTTLSKTYCNSSMTITATAKLRDSAGQTAEASYTSRIRYLLEAPCVVDSCGRCETFEPIPLNQPACSPPPPDDGGVAVVGLIENNSVDRPVGRSYACPPQLRSKKAPPWRQQRICVQIDLPLELNRTETTLYFLGASPLEACKPTWVICTNFSSHRSVLTILITTF